MDNGHISEDSTEVEYDDDLDSRETSSSSEEKTFQEKVGENFEEVERTYVWLHSQKDVDKLTAIGIRNPSIVNKKDPKGVKVIVTVPVKLLSTLGELDFIKFYEDPYDSSLYRQITFY